VKKIKILSLLFGFIALSMVSYSIGESLGTHQHDMTIVLSVIAAGYVAKKGMQYQSNVAYFILDPTDLTWNGKEAQSISDTIYEKTFLLPGLNTIHEIRTGIKGKTQLAFLGRLGLVGKAKSACNVTANTGGIAMTEKFADPAWITDRFEECWEVMKESFFIWGSKEGLAKEDLTDSDFANFLEDRLSEAVAQAIIRIAHFGDLAADTVANGGELVNGTDKTYFNILDGMWAQAIDITVADTDRLNAIAKNAQATYALQRFNSTDVTNKVAETLFESMLYGADFRLRGMTGELMFLCTQSIADQYAKELRSRNLDASYIRIEGGYKALMFEGIPIVPISYWDTLIQTYFKNGTKFFSPHRCILTTKSNIPLMTENEASLSELASNYDAYNKKYFVDFGFMLDMKILEDYLVQVAI